MDIFKNTKRNKFSITEEELRTVTLMFNGKEIQGPAGFGLDRKGLEIGRLWAERQKQKEQNEDPFRAKRISK